MRPILILLASAAFAAAAFANPGAPPGGEPTGKATVPLDAVPSDGLSGEDVYQCVLDNRFDSYVQASSLISGDRGGGEQESRLEMRWKNWREDGDEPRAGVLSKTIVRYTHPFDLRQSGYLVINNHARVNDQFVYLAASRRIRRVNLRGEAVFGTDFSFEDIIPAEIEDADYSRASDSSIDGKPVYVVEVVPKEYANSEYSRFVVYVDKPTCVPLRTRYWDAKEIEIKELRSPAEKIKKTNEIHWPSEMTMRNLQLESYTTLLVQDLVPNAPLKDKEFEVRRLEAH